MGYAGCRIWRTENPRVGSSIPRVATIQISKLLPELAVALHLTITLNSAPRFRSLSPQLSICGLVLSSTTLKLSASASWMCLMRSV